MAWDEHTMPFKNVNNKTYNMIYNSAIPVSVVRGQISSRFKTGL